MDGHMHKNASIASYMHRLVALDGIAWLATQHDLQGVVHFSSDGDEDEGEDETDGGGGVSVAPGLPWWAAVPRETWPAGLAAEIVPLWHEPHGDRQTELGVRVAAAVDRPWVEAHLQAALVSEEELLQGPLALRGQLHDPYLLAWEAELNEDPVPGVIALVAALRPFSFFQCEPCRPCAA